MDGHGCPTLTCNMFLTRISILSMTIRSSSLLSSNSFRSKFPKFSVKTAQSLSSINACLYICRKKGKHILHEGVLHQELSLKRFGFKYRTSCLSRIQITNIVVVSSLWLMMSSEMAHLNSRRESLLRCTLVQQNIGSSLQPVHALTCPNKGQVQFT